MAELLVDTDVFVDHLRGAARLWTGRHRLAYSTVTRAELFAVREADEPRVTELLAPFREIAVDRGVAEAAGRLRRGIGLRMPDALIAATALTGRHGPRHAQPPRLRARPAPEGPRAALARSREYPRPRLSRRRR